VADLTPPELAHQRVIETDSMTLSIGSIFGDQANLAGTLLPDDSREGALRNGALNTMTRPGNDRKSIKSRRSLVDDLLRERRAEVARESKELGATDRAGLRG
jgi:hypothetical protein